MPQADEEPGPPPDTEGETLEAPDQAPDEVEKVAADDDHEGND